MIASMTKNADLHLTPIGFEVVGDIDFNNVMMLYQKSLAKLNDHCVIDFAKLNSSNSAGLALLLGWIKYANHLHKTLIFSNIPSHLLALARIAGIEKILMQYH